MTKLNAKEIVAVCDLIDNAPDVARTIFHRPLMKEIEARGYIVSRTIQTGKRGRPEISYASTGKANQLRNLRNIGKGTE